MAELGRNETPGLISADKVQGTSVYNAQGDKLGTVDKLMIDKVRGNVEYAVMSFGGFLGMGEKRHPLPWDSLDYSTDQGGYVVNMSKTQLENAPAYDVDDESWLSSNDQRDSIYSYYGVTPQPRASTMSTGATRH
jgi:hypothetical protein